MMARHSRSRKSLMGVLLLLSAVLPTHAHGQVASSAGEIAQSAVGQAGQRQTKNSVRVDIKPLGRLNSRIANRVQNRIRNRIDRYYDPQANTTSPFEVAAERSTRIRPARR